MFREKYKSVMNEIKGNPLLLSSIYEKAENKNGLSFNRIHRLSYVVAAALIIVSGMFILNSGYFENEQISYNTPKDYKTSSSSHKADNISVMKDNEKNLAAANSSLSKEMKNRSLNLYDAYTESAEDIQLNYSYIYVTELPTISKKGIKNNTSLSEYSSYNDINISFFEDKSFILSNDSEFFIVKDNDNNIIDDLGIFIFNKDISKISVYTSKNKLYVYDVENTQIIPDKKVYRCDDSFSYYTKSENNYIYIIAKNIEEKHFIDIIDNYWQITLQVV